MEVVENKITLRRLCTRDLFPMMRILSKIGISEFKKCFESAGSNFKKNKNGINIEEIGLAAALEIAETVLKNIGSCERDIYSFLADLSGMDPAEIPELDLTVFAEMVNELARKEEFRDFFTVVLKSVPTEKLSLST